MQKYQHKGCLRFVAALFVATTVFSVDIQADGAGLSDSSQPSLAETFPDLDLRQVAQRGDLVADLRTLRFKAKEQGSIPVILALRMKSKLDVELDGEAQSLQRSRIAALQAGILGELPDGQLQNVKRFRYTPHIAVTVSPEVLERLLQSERVTSIEEDLAVEPSLVQSVPLINANKAWTAGYNGNGWAVAFFVSSLKSAHASEYSPAPAA